MPLTPSTPSDYEFPTSSELLRCVPPPLSPSKRQNLQNPSLSTASSAHPSATSSKAKPSLGATGDSKKDRVPAGASVSRFRPKDLEELAYAARDTRILRETKNKGDAYERLHYLLKTDPNRDFKVQVTTGTVREKLKGLLLWHEHGDQHCPSEKDERLRKGIANLLDDTDIGPRIDSTLDQLLHDREEVTQALDQKSADQAKIDDENERGGAALRDAYRKTYTRKRKAQELEVAPDDDSNTNVDEMSTTPARGSARRKTGNNTFLEMYVKDKEEREKKQEKITERLERTLSSIDEVLALEKHHLRRQGNE